MFYWNWKLLKKFKKDEKKIAVVIDTNVILRMGQFHESGILEKIQGSVFIPWPVLEEMIAFRKEAICVKRRKEKYGEEPPFMRRITESDRKTRRQRHKSTLNAWPVFSKMIEDEWKIIGSSSRQYFEIFDKVGEDVGSSDTRILAACKNLQAQGWKVVLLTRDRRFKTLAEQNGVQVESSLTDLIKKS